MSKQGIIFYAVLALLVLFVGQNFLHQFSQYKEEISQTKQDLKDMRRERDQLLDLVEAKNAEQKKIEEQVTAKEGELAALRNQVKELKEQQERDRAMMYRIVDDAASLQKFRETYPRFHTGAQSVEVNEVIDVDGVPTPITHQRVFMPVAYLDEFVRVKQDRNSFEEQMKQMVLADAVQEEIKALKDEAFRLEREKAEAFQEGYEKAFAMFETTQARYLEVLKAKRFANVFQAIGGFAAGAALGVNF